MNGQGEPARAGIAHIAFLATVGVAAVAASARALTSQNLLVGGVAIMLFAGFVALLRVSFVHPALVAVVGPSDGTTLPSAVRDEQYDERVPEEAPRPVSVPDMPPTAAHASASRPEVRIPATMGADVVAMALLESAAAAGDVVAAHCWLEDPSSATLRQVSAVGSLVPEPHPRPLDDDPLGLAVTECAARMTAVAAVHTSGERSTLWRFAVPVEVDDARGVFGIDFSAEEPPDSRKLVEITAALRPSLAGCLALHVAKQESATARVLVEAARELTRRLDPDAVISHALSSAMALSDAATGSIMLLDGDSGQMTISAASGLDDDIVRDTRVREGEGIAGWVLATRKPVLIEDLPGRSARSRRGDVRSAVSVPIADEDGILGVLNVGSGAYPARFTDSHMEALQLLGTQTAAALRSARALTSARDLYFATLRALALALETKDPYSRGGTERVVRYTTALGDALGLDEIEKQSLEVAALLHDIGMASAGEAVATSGRPLSTFERGLLKLHPVLAAEILEEVPALRDVIPIVYHHHEWFDGRGYVVGLTGESIPLGARILSVADAFVAMTSDRPYRSAMSTSEALDELQDKAGSQFDPEVVEMFLDMMRRQPELAPDAHRE
ncbi:MAG TPA: HD domain-containing phosphohydrolase [Coriobacteriia bacterium]